MAFRWALEARPRLGCGDSGDRTAWLRTQPDSNQSPVSSRWHWSRTRSRIAHVGALLCWMPSAAAAPSWLRLSGRGRKARALELDPAYVDVAVRRWQTYTGKAAVLAASGETFETIEEQRAAKPAAA